MMSILSLSRLQAIEPTDWRVWKSTTGHSIEARATAANENDITLEKRDGSKIIISRSKLSEDDVKLISTYFKQTHNTKKDAGAPKNTPSELGKISKPIAATDKSHYLLFLPASLKDGRKAPVMHFNGSGGGNEGEMERYIEGAGRFRWILAASIESKNDTHGNYNLSLAKDNVDHLKQSPLVDAKRIYFTGQSGGGAMSWWNFVELNGAGTMPAIGYIPREVSPRGGHHFIIDGATDYNRNLAAVAAKRMGKNATLRYYPGGHAYPEDSFTITEGYAWLTAMYLLEKKSDATYQDEIKDFEASILHWVDELSVSHPEKAYHIAMLMKSFFTAFSTANLKVLDGHITKLAAKSEQKLFHEGIGEIEKYGIDEYSGLVSAGMVSSKIDSSQSRKFLKVAEKYKGVTFVYDTFVGMSKDTD